MFSHCDFRRAEGLEPAATTASVRRPLVRPRHHTTPIAVTVGILLLLSIDAGAQGVSQAWWVGATFIPRGTVVEGIEISHLDRKWKRASIISPGDLPPEARKPGYTIDEHGFPLALEADLDADGKRERVVVGVYETTTDETGRFLLILSQSRQTGRWEKRALFKDKGPPRFGAVSIVDGRLQWGRLLDMRLCLSRPRHSRWIQTPV